MQFNNNADNSNISGKDKRWDRAVHDKDKDKGKSKIASRNSNIT